MRKKHSLNLVPLDFGPLPVDVINRTLGTDLHPGHAHLSINAQKHASKRHPAEYAKCLPHVASVIANPTYLGDDFANDDRIELVARVTALGQALLVAIEIIRDNNGRYNVTSFYPVSQKKIDNRREKGHLIIAKKH